MSLQTLTDSPTNASEFTVSEISGALKRTVEDAFGNVRVRGEISGYRGPHASGHAYFALKDERARLEAVIWRTTFQRLRFRPEEGMEVIAAGRLTTYPGSSKYQIVIDSLEPAGAGALMALLEERKRRLDAEGLFAAAAKRALPFMPRVIGVVTSPTGAVIRDIIHRITDRFPLHVLVWPVRVQGETTGQEVSAAIRGFNMLDGGAVPRPDVLIVARGGGSLEDLWGFNDEAVVRAVAESRIPVISAVGHETDWTLIDLAADRRAPTPTGAAELAVPVRADLEAGLASLAARLKACTSRHLDRRGQALRAAARALPSPDQLLALPRRHFDECSSRLVRALEVGTQQKQARLAALRLLPSALSRRTVACRREVEQTGLRLQPLLRHLVSHRRSRFDRIGMRVTETALRRRIADGSASLAHAVRRADQCIQAQAETRRLRLAQSWRLAETLSYQSVLQRGFALVRDVDRQPVKTAAALKPGAQISIEFADGQVGALTAGKVERKKGGRTSTSDAQESLF